MARYDYLILGGGMAADAAAHGIRQEDPRGTIAIVGAEPHAPYNRPPLSKGSGRETQSKVSGAQPERRARRSSWDGGSSA